MTTGQCDICNRAIEEHLRNRGKRLCFACLTEEASSAGTVPTFNIKNKPVQAPCAVCELETASADLVASPWGFICQNCCAICETQTGFSWEMMKLAAQKEWIVKSNLKILGPFTTEEVEQQLRDNGLVAHDEIIKPAGGRWHLLRDEDQFRLVLNEIRNKKTNSRQNSFNTGDSTQSETLAPDEAIAREQAFSTFSLLEGVEEAPPQASSTHSVREVKPEATTRDLVKSYASREDVRVRQEISQSQGRKIWFALFFLLAAGIFVALKVTNPQGGSADARNQEFQQDMTEGFKAEKVGDFQKALLHFNEARALKPNDSELLLHLAPLVLVYDKQVLQAQRMFKQILDTEQSPNYQRTGQIGLGLVSMELHEWDEARDYFQKALAFDAEYLPAIANLGMVAFFKNDMPVAEGYMLRALEKGNSDGAMVIALGDMNMSSATDSSPERGKLQSAHKLFESYLDLSRDYAQEVMIKDARILSLLGKQNDVAHRLERFLDSDPEASDLHLRDWQVYRGLTEWGLLLDDLRKVAQTLSPSPRLTATLGLAMYRGGEKLQGAQTIEQALNQSPKDPLIQALAGWVEFKLGRKDVAMVNIHEAAQAQSKYQLPHILQARLCMEEKDFECAKTEWSTVLRLDGRSPEALHGLASIAWEKDHDRQTVMNDLTQLYADDPTYIPYLQLLQEISTPQVPGGGKGP